MVIETLSFTGPLLNLIGNIKYSVTPLQCNSIILTRPPTPLTKQSCNNSVLNLSLVYTFTNVPQNNLQLATRWIWRKYRRNKASYFITPIMLSSSSTVTSSIKLDPVLNLTIASRSLPAPFSHP